MVKMITPQYLHTQLDATRVMVDGQPIDSGVEMLRVGDDLVLIQADGSEMVIEGYFLELLEEGEEAEGGRQLAEAEAASAGGVASPYVEGGLPAVNGDVGTLGEFSLAQAGAGVGGMFGAGVSSASVVVATAVVASGVMLASSLKSDSLESSESYVTYNDSGTGTLSFSFSTAVKSGASATITAKTSKGTVVTSGTVASSGASITDATKFLEDLGDQGTITVKVQLDSNKTIENTYTYYSAANAEVDASLAILDTSGADFTLTGNGHQVSVIAAKDVTGSDNADKIVVTGSATSIDGGMGDDTLTGGSGADNLMGGAGADTIAGGNGDDTIDGGAGGDTITGGAGADSLTGGSGSDVFIYTGTGDGGDTIKDFETVSDSLDLFGTGRVIAGDKVGNDFVTHAGGATVVTNSVILSKNSAALGDTTAAAGLFQTGTADTAKMTLKEGDTVILVRQDDNSAQDPGYAAQVFHVTSDGTAVAATLIATLGPDTLTDSTSIAFADFV